MSHAHVCDNCLTVAPIGEAIGWWSLEELGDISVITMSEKPEYHFCSKKCALEYLVAEAARMTPSGE